MMPTASAAARAARIYLFRRLGRPRTLPMSLTLSITDSCDMRCRTCHLWQRRGRRPGPDSLTSDEYDRILASIGGRIYHVTVTGGEPFDRDDLVEICASVHDRCRPFVMVIPTSGYSPGRVSGRTEQIMSRCPGSRIVVNLSIDGIGDRHDRLRGRPGAFERVIETFQALRRLKSRNLTVGTNTVISRYNAVEIPAIHRYLSSLRPDSMVFDLAEPRSELGTFGESLTPEGPEAEAALRFVADALRSERRTGLARLIRALRLASYAELIRTVWSGRTRLPCMAAFASAHLQPDGELWSCPAAGMSMGNLKDDGYDFRRVYFGEKAREVRARIRLAPCSCTTATMGYLNLICSPSGLARTARTLFRGAVR